MLIAGGTATMTAGMGYGAPGCAIDSAELYDPLTGVFVETGHLAHPRRSHQAFLPNDGRVVLVGGMDNCTPDITTFAIYDPTLGIFLSAEGT